MLGVRLCEQNSLTVCRLSKPWFAEWNHYNVSDANLELLLSFADEYDLSCLNKRCDQYLLAKAKELPDSDAPLLDRLVLADKYKLKLAVEAIIPKVEEGQNIIFIVHKFVIMLNFLKHLSYRLLDRLLLLE